MKPGRSMLNMHKKIFQTSCHINPKRSPCIRQYSSVNKRTVPPHDFLWQWVWIKNRWEWYVVLLIVYL